MNMRKHRIAIITGAIVTCVIFALLLVFLVNPPVHAAEPVAVTLDNLDDYTYTGSAGNYQITGLSDTGKQKIANAGSDYQIYLNFPAGATSTSSWSTGNNHPLYNYLTKIVSVTLPDGFTTLGNSAFSGCSKLANVQLPGTLTTLGNYVFSNCAELTSIDLSRTKVTQIGNYDFSNCTKLANVQLPDTLTTLGTYVFNSCVELTSIDLSRTKVTQIGNYDFNNCTKLANVQLPDTLTSIGSNAFYKSGLTGLDLSHIEVASIGGSAFYQCTKLASVQLPDTLTTLDGSVFNGCTNLTSIDLSRTKVTQIGNYAFYQCSNLASVQLPDTLTGKIGEYAFNECGALAVDIDLSRTKVTAIGQNAFYQCSNLGSVKLPVGLTSIGDSAFAKSGVTDVEFPNTLTTLDYYAFGSCARLTSVDLSATQITKFGGSQMFNGCTNLASVQLPTCFMTFVRQDFASTAITGIDLSQTQVTKIPDSAFQNCRNLVSVEWPANLTEIGASAFYGTGFTELKFPDTLTTLGASLFSGCEELTSIDLSNTQVTKIPDSAFQGCRNLVSIDLSQTKVTEIDRNAFANCDNLIYVQLPAGLTKVYQATGGNASYDVFYKSSKLAALICPDAEVCTTYKTLAGLTTHVNKLTYPIGLQINLTDQNQEHSVYAEKMLAGANFTDWHYVDDAWVKDPNHVMAALPALPSGWIWQDDEGYELTAERIKALLTQAQNGDALVVINAQAVEEPKPTITKITGLTARKVYDGTTKATVDFSHAVYTGIINNQDVYVRLRPGVIVHYESANVGTNIKVTILASDLMLQGADADEYALANNIIVEVNGTITPADLTASATGGAVTYDGQSHDTITPGKVLLASENDRDSVQWQYSYDQNSGWQDAIPTMTTVGSVTLYYKVSATNHNDYVGSVTFKIEPRVVAVPEKDTREFVYAEGVTHTYQIAESDLYTVTGNQQSVIGVHHVTVALKDKTNYVWSNGSSADLDYVFTINAAAFSGELNYTVYEGTYNGQPHAALEIKAPANDGAPYKWSFSTDNGQTYQDTIPQFTNAGNYTVCFKITADNYQDYNGTCEVKIAKAKLAVTVAAHTVLQKTAANLTEFTVTGLVADETPADVIELFCNAYDMNTAAVGETFSILARVKGTYAENYEIGQMNPGTLTVVKNPDLPEPEDPNQPGTGDDDPNQPSQPGQPTKIKAPTESTQKFIYNGKQQTYLPQGYNENTMVMTGAVQRAVGRYTVTVRPRTNYVFDNGKDEVTFDFVIEQAEIIVRKNGDEWFDERIEGGDLLASALEISFLAKVDGAYKYIVTVDGCPITIRFKPGLYKVGGNEPVPSGYSEVNVPTIPQNTAVGRYEIYYQIMADNHKVKEGIWRVEIADKDAYLIVIFKKAFTVTYSQDYMTMLSDIFETDEYITVYEYIGGVAHEMDLAQFKTLVDVYVVTKNPNSFKFQNVGKYDICFKYKSNVDSNRTIIYKLTNDGYNTNEDMLEIRPAELTVNWGKMEYTYSDGATYDIVAELVGHTNYAERNALKLKFVIRTVDGQVIDHITQPGSYMVEAVLVDDFGNFVIADASRSRIIVVHEAKAELPWLFWIIIAAIAAIFIILFMLIIFMRKK